MEKQKGAKFDGMFVRQSTRETGYDVLGISAGSEYILYNLETEPEAMAKGEAAAKVLGCEFSYQTDPRTKVQAVADTASIKDGNAPAAEPAVPETPAEPEQKEVEIGKAEDITIKDEKVAESTTVEADKVHADTASIEKLVNETKKPKEEEPKTKPEGEEVKEAAKVAEPVVEAKPAEEKPKTEPEGEVVKETVIAEDTDKINKAYDLSAITVKSMLDVLA